MNMEEKTYILSICIPTYNRAEYLKQNIESIICQKPFIDGEVEVVVSDNASTDNTEEIMRSYADRYENIKYYRNTINIGPKNHPLVLWLGNGILRKLYNDRVVFMPDSLIKIIKLINRYKQEKAVLFFSNNNRLSINKIANLSEYIRQISFNMTWIGSFSLWEDDVIEVEKDSYDCDLQLWHVRKILETICKHKKVYILNDKLVDVINVDSKDISYGLYKVFYQNYFLLLEPYFANKQLSMDDKEFLEKDLLYNFFTNWIIRWELQDKHLIYSKEENLKQAVFLQYKNKPYFKSYKRFYLRKKYVYMLKEKIKNVIRKIRKVL